PEVLLDIFRYFVFYEENQTKVVPRYMQYYASEKILNRIKKGEPRKGLIWHTQGSGKSYTMLFAAYKAKKSPGIEDKQYLLIVDRKKLDDQMADTLAAIDFPSYSVAKNIDHLGELLGENKAQLILTTIHKFGGVDDKVKADVDLDTVVMVDEAHRYMERKLGNKLKAALPDAFYFGFTGTPVREGEDLEDRNTFREFSPPEDEGYLHRYSLNDGIRDEVITRVTFTLKEIPWEIPDEKRMDMEFEEMVQNLGPEERRKMLREYVNQTELSELRDRLEKVTRDIVDHYDRHLRPLGFKGMVVTPSRRAAALYGDELEKYMDPEEVKVVITTSGDDPEVIQRRYLTDDEERKVIKKFKEEEDPKLLVVCDKLLTGFDAPVLKTLYLDKSMKNHRLLQAIARTNRPMEGKENGEIVDYAGVFADPEAVLQYEDVEFVAQAARDTEELVDEFLEKLDNLISFFEDIEFDSSPETLRKCIVKLEKNPEIGNKFEDLYKEAENLYESVSPHERLGKKEVERKWAIISQIYEEFKREEDRVSLSEEIRAKTRNILEKHIDFGEIGPGKGAEYELPDKDVKVVEGEIDPDYAVVDEGGRLRHTYEREKEKNPVYSSLSERVKKIMERWRRDELSPSEAMEKLEEIREEEKEIQSEQEERGLSDVEFSLFQLLTSKYDGFLSGKGEAEELAKAIGESVSGLSLKGNISQIKRDLRSEVIRVLVDRDKTDLAKHEDKAFLDDSIQYIVKNVEG
ncbi:MAG: type I restriction endonuclease subunit R, partial [Candidatus Hadarchaeia archaeon]